MGWNKIKLGHIIKRVKDPVKIKSDKEYSLVTIRMYHKGVAKRAVVKGSSIKSSTLYSIKPNQFILSGIDARNRAFGIVPEELNGAVITNDFWTHEINSKVINLGFFYWFTTTPQFYEACIKASEGTTNRQRLQADKFYDFDIWLPSILEQQAHVKKIKAISKKSDLLNYELSLQQSHLQQLRQAILQEAVQGKLTEPESLAGLKDDNMKGNKKILPSSNPENHDPDNEPAEKLFQRIKAQKQKLVAAGKLKKEKELPSITVEEIPFELPKDWVWCRLGQISDVGTGGTPLTSTNDYYNGNIPWITSSATGSLFVSEAEKFITEKALEETNCKVYPIGTLIVAMYGQGKTRGQITELLIEAATNQACASIELIIKENYHKEYVKYFFQKIYLEIRELAAGGAQPNLNLQKIKETMVPLPPLSEQHRIVAKVQQLMQMVSQLEQQVQQSQEQAQQLLQAVLKEAFSNKDTKHSENVMLAMAAEE